MTEPASAPIVGTPHRAPVGNFNAANALFRRLIAGASVVNGVPQESRSALPTPANTLSAELDVIADLPDIPEET